MLVGQPAEEIVAGATAMLRDGLFTRFRNPITRLGMHDEHSLPAGVIGFHPGYFRANSTGLEMTVYGKGGHGAFPQSAIDPVVIAARIVLGLQTIVSRENNPVDPAGDHGRQHPRRQRLQHHSRPGEAPDHRALARSRSPQAPARSNPAPGEGEALAANAPKEPLIETKSNTDAVYNDPELTQRMVAAARAALGADGWSRCRHRWAEKTSRNSGWQACAPCAARRQRFDAAKWKRRRKSGVPVPSVHSPSCGHPERGCPRSRAAISAVDSDPLWILLNRASPTA
jgi:hippurate hydrolase